MAKPNPSAAVTCRLFTSSDLVPGGTVRVESDRAHYLRNVLRLSPGDAVGLFNGRDGEYRGVIERLAKNEASLVLAEQLRAQAPEGDAWLLFAPIKRAPIDLLVEKATELGAARLTPVLTRHTDVVRVNLARLGAIAIEAAEQCGRLTVPTIDAPLALDQALAGWDTARRLYVCAEKGPSEPISRLVGRAPKGKFALLVGPEGGFAEGELDGLRNLDFVSALDLGPRILRAETAALASLAILQAWLGDWS